MTFCRYDSVKPVTLRRSRTSTTTTSPRRTFTFDTDPYPVGARTHWFTQFGETGPHRLYVGEVEGTVIGYATSTPFKARSAYRTSVETTIYVHPEHWRRGFGEQLMAWADRRARTDGYESVTLWVMEKNQGARSFYETLGWIFDGSTRSQEIQHVSVNKVRYTRDLTAPSRGPLKP